MKPQTLLKYLPVKIINGYTNNILWVDLTNNIAKIEPVSKDMKRDFQGGRGYAIKILYEHTTEKTDPLGPDNILIIAPGPMTGEYRWPGGSKTVIAALSPLTNGYGEASLSGRSGEKVKRSGFDTICITGKANTPSILVIDGEEGEIRLHCDSNDIKETKALNLGKNLINIFGKDETAVFTIGIAGRNLVRFACINGIHEQNGRFIPRQAGRTGLGAVMGSKNIVAIAVIGSEQKPVVANEQALEEAGKKMRAVIAANDKNQMYLSRKGTAGLVEMMNEVNVLPINNFSTSKKPEAENLSSSAFIEKIFQQNQPCSPGCNLMCGKLSQVKLPNGKKVEVDGPEYETIGMLGSNLGIFDPAWVAEANYMCDCLGLDTISTGGIIGFAMECFEKGYLNVGDTGGLELRFGNVEVVRKLIPQIAKREGFGKILADGILKTIEFVVSRNPGKRADIESFAVHAKGMELSAYIPRESIAMQVAYGTSLIGAHHREAWLIFIDAVRKEIPTFDLKAETLVFYQNMRTWVDIAGFCKLHWIDVRNPESNNPKNLATVNLYIQAINAVTGLDWNMGQHLTVAVRAYNLAKLINIRRGLGRKDDHLPARAMGSVTLEEYDKLLEKYYELRGWDRNGIPLPQTLKSLGLPVPNSK